MYLAAVGPEEPRAVRRAVRRLAGDLLLAGLRQGAARRRSRPAGRRSARRSRASTSCRPCRSSSATTRAPAPTRSAGTPRCTSAAWAAARRTSTTSSPSRMGFEEAAGEGPGPLPRPEVRRGRRGGAVRVPRRHRAARAQGAHRREDAGAGRLRRHDADAVAVRRLARGAQGHAAHRRRGARARPASATDDRPGPSRSGSCRGSPRSSRSPRRRSSCSCRGCSAGRRRTDRTTFAAGLHAGSCLGIAWALRSDLRALDGRTRRCVGGVVGARRARRAAGRGRRRGAAGSPAAARGAAGRCRGAAVVGRRPGVSP